MNWILVIVLWTSAGQTAVPIGRFESEQACRTGGQKVLKDNDIEEGQVISFPGTGVVAVLKTPSKGVRGGVISCLPTK